MLNMPGFFAKELIFIIISIVFYENKNILYVIQMDKHSNEI